MINWRKWRGRFAPVAVLMLLGACSMPAGNGNDNGSGNDNGTGNDNGGDNTNDNMSGGSLTADAGEDRDVATGAAVTLDGSGSTASDDAAITFSWSQTAGDTVELTGADTQMPTFTAPDAAGALTFELAVEDTAGRMDTDSVTITVTAEPATLFVVNNGDDLTTYANASTLDGVVAPSSILGLGATTSLFQPRSPVVTTSERLLVGRQNGGIVGYDNALALTEDKPADVEVDGANTLLVSVIALAYDPANDRLFVGNSNATEGILIFENVSGPGFTGEVMPVTFGPPDRVPFNDVSTSIAMTVDALDFGPGGSLFASDTSGLNVNSSRILVFDNPGEASGQAVPVAVLTGPWGDIEDLAVSDDDTLYIVDSSDTVFVFADASTLDGELTDPVTIQIQVELASLEGIVIGSDGTGYVADAGNAAIYVIPEIAAQSGMLTPPMTLEGTGTELRSPRQMFLLEP